MKEHKQIIYEQDCEFARYEDRLRWSRFATAATIEGGVLAGIYYLDIPRPELHLAMLGGFLLVGIVLAISVRNMYYWDAYRKRIRSFERDAGVKDVSARKVLGVLTGRRMMLAIILVVNIFNVILVLLKW